jgi:hypothetical protein
MTRAKHDKSFYGDREPLVFRSGFSETPVDDNLPFVDDSVSGTPLSDSESGPLVVSVPVPSVVHSTSVHPSNLLHSRHSSYTSHSSRISYTSHGEVYGRGMPVPWNVKDKSSVYPEVRSNLNHSHISSDKTSLCSFHSDQPICYFSNTIDTPSVPDIQMLLLLLISLAVGLSLFEC